MTPINETDVPLIKKEFLRPDPKNFLASISVFRMSRPFRSYNFRTNINADHVGEDVVFLTFWRSSLALCRFEVNGGHREDQLHGRGLDKTARLPVPASSLEK